MSAPDQPLKLRCEYKENPLGLDEPRPRLSWIVNDDRRGARQSAYRVLVASSPRALDADEGDLWDSGKVDSDQSVHVEYAGEELASRERCWWMVRTWDADGRPSPWSDAAWWEMGLLDRDEWGADWISIPPREPGANQPAPFLRTEFDLDATVRRARAYVTARGIFELRINGRRVGDDRFVPGWTDYRRRIQYLTYDVTEHLQSGANAVGAILGDGWFCGRMGWEKGEAVYGAQPQLMLRLEIETSAGVKPVVTNAAWRASTGPVLSSDIYDGETYDARLEMPGWDRPGFDDADWSRAGVFDDEGASLDAKVSPPVRPIQEVPPIEVTEPEPGVHIYNLGQNIVGWARVRLSGRAGQTVTLRFGEMLKDDGTLYTANLRSAKATDRYTFAEDGQVTWQPQFTFHGFQYVEITGVDAAPPADAVSGVVLHNDMQPTGTFECSHDLLNKLQSNIRWGQKGNFLEVPTDCPQRDERLGWTGDAQIFVRTACFNFDVAGFFTKWQRDIADAQGPKGGIPPIVPNLSMKDLGEVNGGPAWADAVVICPWTIYRCYGDTRILERHYDSCRRFIGSLQERSHDLIRADEMEVAWGGFGDWVAMDAPAGDRVGATPKGIIGTAYFAYSTSLVARMARLLGKDDEAEELEQLHGRIVQAFNRRFVTREARLVGDTQTAYLLALAFDLLPEQQRPAALGYLVRLIERKDYHLTTGFVGTPLLCPVLGRFGRADVAYKLLLQTTYPSWLYTVLQGATTMWERWNSYTKKNGFGPVGMNSFNHYAYGSIGAWMYRAVAGLDVRSAGFKTLAIHPQPGEGLEGASAALETLYGRAESAWSIEDGRMTLRVTVPPSTTAQVRLPAARAEEVKEGETPLEEAPGITAVQQEGQDVVCEAGAGKYRFTWERATG